jgi:hypothetical protein
MGKILATFEDNDFHVSMKKVHGMNLLQLTAFLVEQLADTCDGGVDEVLVDVKHVINDELEALREIK